jgi:hypothetical protein
VTVKELNYLSFLITMVLLVHAVFALSSCASLPQEDTGSEESAAPVTTPESPAAPGGERAPASDGSGRPEPAPRETDGADWIRLKTGEWLKGRLMGLENEILAFESETSELGDLEFDWEDVAEVRSAGKALLRLDDGTTLHGVLHVREETAVVRDEKEHRFPRHRLLTVASGTRLGPIVSYWSGDVSFGTTFRQGNTDQLVATANASLRRRTAISRFDIDYKGSFGRLEGVETTNNHRITLEQDIFLTHRFYATPLYIEYYRDLFQNIQHRVTPGAAAGYRIIDQKHLDWEAQVGAGYQYTRYDSVPAGADREGGTAALLGGSTVELDITKDVDLKVKYDLQLGLESIKSTFHHALVTISVDLTTVIDLDVTFTWNRAENPLPGSDGEIPERNDFGLTVGFGIDF